MAHPSLPCFPLSEAAGALDEAWQGLSFTPSRSGQWWGVISTSPRGQMPMECFPGEDGRVVKHFFYCRDNSGEH